MSDRPILFSAPMVLAIMREIDHPGTGKTMTRRVLKPQPPSFIPNVIDIGVPHQDESGEWGQIETIWSDPSFDSPRGEPLREEWRPLRLPAKPGDRLYVRETCALWMKRDGKLILPPDGDGPVYKADTPHDEWAAMLADQTTLREINCGRSKRFSGNWSVRPSIHMPRWASRLTLIVSEVKVERLQSISEEDAKAEGVLSWAAWLMDQSGVSADDIDAMSSTTGEPPGSMRAGFAALWESINSPGSWKRNDWVAAITFRAIKANIDALTKKDEAA